MYKYFLAFFLVFGFGQYDYNLEDINTSSDYYTRILGLRIFQIK